MMIRYLKAIFNLNSLRNPPVLSTAGKFEALTIVEKLKTNCVS